MSKKWKNNLEKKVGKGMLFQIVEVVERWMGYVRNILT